jgi:hypothetical protein
MPFALPELIGRNVVAELRAPEPRGDHALAGDHALGVKPTSYRFSGEAKDE